MELGEETHNKNVCLEMNGEESTTLYSPQPQSVWMIALPLASLTAVGMLATDLYLPAVPTLPHAIGGSIVEAQWTLASFLGCLALSQILWGWASDRFGELSVIQVGMALLIGGSVICALSSHMTVLIFGRAIQGFGAGSATTAVPSLLRKRFNDTNAVKSISVVGIAESVVPAFGPILGAALISVTTWQVTFWVIAGLTAALFPFVSNVAGDGSTQASAMENPFAAVKELLMNPGYLRLSFSYAMMFGALLMFVASAPQIVVNTFRKPATWFSIIQLFGVGTFVLAVSMGSKVVALRGIPFVLRVGSGLQLLSCAIFLILAFGEVSSFVLLVFAWSIFCGGLGLRGPSSMAIALSVVSETAGQASGILMFLSFGIASAATAAVAPFLVCGLVPVSLALASMIGLSVLLARHN